MNKNKGPLEKKINVFLNEFSQSLRKKPDDCLGIVLRQNSEPVQKYMGLFLTEKGVEAATGPVEKQPVSAARFWHSIHLGLKMYDDSKARSIFSLKEEPEQLPAHLKGQRFLDVKSRGYEQGYLIVLTVGDKKEQNSRSYKEKPTGYDFL